MEIRDVDRTDDDCTDDDCTDDDGTDLNRAVDTVVNDTVDPERTQE